jgi:hypothetical protein
LALAPVVFSKSPKPGAIALRLDFDLKGRDPTARSEGPVLASGESLVQALRAAITYFQAEKQIICAKDHSSPSDWAVGSQAVGPKNKTTPNREAISGPFLSLQIRRNKKRQVEPRPALGGELRNF